MSQGQDLLWEIVRWMFPGKEILVNTRPSWLAGLELDLYLPDMHLALEFDGPQHRFPVGNMYKGKEMFKYSSKNDHWKDKTCKENGVRLVRISARTLKPVRVRQFIIKSGANFGKNNSSRVMKAFPYDLEKRCAFYRKQHAYTTKERKFRQKNQSVTISPVGKL